ncbi:MAG: hypothetical protein QY332_03165 [Anaerolineales bacterium]|nr:MAG: hypothetical protein QY332_03165 [Anaerolineales bacterium]
MSFDETNFDDLDDAPLPEESNNNRTFLIAVGILGGIILISLACLVGVYLFGSQTSTNAQQTQIANATQTAQAANEFVSMALTATFEASIILPTATLEPTTTSVVNVPTATETPDPNAVGGTPAAATATVGAALTQAAAAQLTIIPTTTALPNTGFMDDYGVPGLVVMALAFVIVILLARTLRSNNPAAG